MFKLKYLWYLMKGKFILHIGPFIFWWVCVYYLYILIYSGDLFIHLYQCILILTKLVLYWIVLQIYVICHLFSFCLWLYFMLSNKHFFSLWILSIESQSLCFGESAKCSRKHGPLGESPTVDMWPHNLFSQDLVQLSPNVLICRGKGVSRQCYPHSSTCFQD